MQYDLNKQKLQNYTKKLKRVIYMVQRETNNNAIKLSDNKQKTTWNIINSSKFNFPKEPVDKIKSDNGYISHPELVAEAFNNFFVDKVSLSPEVEYHSNQGIESSTASMFMSPCTAQDICKIIKTMKNKKSVGADDISTKVVKHVAEFVAIHLSHLINMSIETGVFPDNLKIANVKPLFKKEDRENMKYYRPIALMSIFSKIFEKYIANQLYSYLEKFKLLAKEQKGFRKSKTINLAI